MLTYTLAGPYWAALGPLAEACALAGWQALDLGRSDEAWALHETAKAAALESGTRQSLPTSRRNRPMPCSTSTGRAADAVHQVRHAHETAGTRIPARRCVPGLGRPRRKPTRALVTRPPLDRATRLGRECAADELPCLAVDEAQLTRWRGHCLARLGAADAMDDLTLALESRRTPRWASRSTAAAITASHRSPREPGRPLACAAPPTS